MFLTFEGIDGSGKTTQAQRLVERLKAEGMEVLFMREPGGTPLSEAVRTLLLDPDLDITPYAELLLFSAARAQLVRHVIQPALNRGAVVVCDRFYDSTLAYQGAGRGVEEFDWLHEFQLRVTGGLSPHRTYFIDISPAEARMRRADRGAEDRMEQAGHDFHERVAQAYDRLAGQMEDRILRIDGRQSIEAIEAVIWDDVARLRTGTPLARSGSS